MITRLLISLIRIYQKTEPVRNSIMRQLHLPRHECKFSPSCSEHMILQIQKEGVVKGIISGIRQIVRCR
ncbi:MAG: membrane protein insertion efficiency factor YidD [bacterium]